MTNKIGSRIGKKVDTELTRKTSDKIEKKYFHKFQYTVSTLVQSDNLIWYKIGSQIRVRIEIGDKPCLTK